MSDLPSTGRQLRTGVTSAGELKLNLVDVPTAALTRASGSSCETGNKPLESGATVRDG